MHYRVISRFLAMALIFSVFVSLLSLSASAETSPAAAEEYAALFPLPEEPVYAPILDAAPLPENLLQGKSIMFFGDSLTAGYGLTSYSQSWCAMLGSRYGMTVTNNSISGSTFATSKTYGYKAGGCYEPYVYRTLPQGKFDIIFVEGGGNDCYCRIPLGSNLDSRDVYTFMGAVNVVIDRLTAQYPNAMLLFMTSWIPHDPGNVNYTKEKEYYEALSQICARRGVPCFQARDPAVSGIYATDASFRKQYFLTTTDYWHLNAAGQALFLPTIAYWLNTQVQARDMLGAFYDVPKSAWYADAVNYAVQKGIFNGVDSAHFCPETAATRGMFATTFHRAMGAPSAAGLSVPFTDVAPNGYYRDAVAWCYSRGIIEGVGDGRFAPDAPLTRQDLVSILYRWTVSPQADDTDAIPENLSRFTDCTDIADYARVPMSWAVETGLITGTNTGELLPTGMATRAHLATILQRYLTKFPH